MGLRRRQPRIKGPFRRGQTVPVHGTAGVPTVAPTGPDLIPVAGTVSYSGHTGPGAQINEGDHLVWSVTVKNQGTTATPAGTAEPSKAGHLTVLFRTDDNIAGDDVWEDIDAAALAAGATRVETADGGSQGHAYQTARPGDHTLNVEVNPFVGTTRRIAESDTTNNRLDYNFTVVAAPSGPPGGALPSDIAAATPAWRTLAWAGGSFLGYSQALQQTWHDRGAGGQVYLTKYPYGIGGDQDFIGTTAASLGAQYQHQRQLEGVSGPSMPAVTHATGGLAFYGVYFQSNEMAPYTYPAPPQVGPFGDWFDTTRRDLVVGFFARLSAAAALTGLDGIAGDVEAYFNKSWRADLDNGHTAAANRAEAEDWGYRIGQVYYAAKPGGIFVTYGFYPEYGWARGYFGPSIPPPDTYHPLDELIIDFLQGFYRAMMEANTGGLHVMIDAFWYRETSQVGGVSVDNAWWYNLNYGLAGYSQYFDRDVWDYMAGRLKIVPMSMASTDASSFLRNTQPTHAGWSQMVQHYRRLGMGGIKFEYAFDGDWESVEGEVGLYQGQQYYKDPTSIAGMQAAADQTPHDTTLPTIRSTSDVANTVTSVDNGDGTWTISFRAAHALGIECAHVWVDPTGPQRAAVMTVNANGGTPQTGFPNAYMTCVVDDLVAADGNTVNVTVETPFGQRRGISVAL